jgi:hypothetical protein
VPLLALCFMGLLVWTAGSDTVVGQTALLTERSLALFNSQRLGQSFTAPADRLHRLDLIFGANRSRNGSVVTLTINDEAGREIVQQEITIRERPFIWYDVHFPAVSGIEGQTLRFVLERETPAAESIGFWVGPGTYYDGYGIFRGTRDDSFDFAFRAYMATPPRLDDRLERVGQLARDLTVNRPGPFGQPAFLLATGAVYASGLALLVCLMVRHLQRR